MAEERIDTTGGALASGAAGNAGKPVGDTGKPASGPANATSAAEERRQRYRQQAKGNGGRRRPPRGARMPGQKVSKENLKTLGRVMGYLMQDYKVAFLFVLACIAVSCAAMLVGTLFMRALIDDYIIPLTQQSSPDFSALRDMLVYLALFLAVGILCTYAYNRIMVNVTQGTLKRIRIELFSKMETLPISYFDIHSHGDIMSVYTNDVDTLRQVISQTIPRTFEALINVTITFISMVALCVPLTALSVVMVFVMLFTTTNIAKRSGKHFMQQQADLGMVNGYVEEMVEGQRVIKVFNHEDTAIADFTEMNEQLRDSAYKANLFANITMPVNANIGNISYVLIAVVGAMLALAGFPGLTLGTLVAFLTLNRNFSQPITQLSQQVNSLVMAVAGAERVFNLMDEEPEADEGKVTLVRVVEGQDGALSEVPIRTGIWAWKVPQADGSFRLVRMRGAVAFSEVDFGYTADKEILHSISLYAEPGQQIAFVGETGAGKTTITNLINRFYDIQRGTITYDGINVCDIAKDDLRRSLGIVLQEVNLFTGTVMDNIRFGRLEASDEDCIRAAELANADGFIRRLPEGYNTVLKGDGGNLSQGQRQLISIARAAVADPPALILDEATSSIDTHTEALVQRGMNALMEGRTSFVIAHRLSTVRNADCIMVLDHGCIIERGSHDELLAERGKYYQLYTGGERG